MGRSNRAMSVMDNDWTEKLAIYCDTCERYVLSSEWDHFEECQIRDISETDEYCETHKQNAAFCHFHMTCNNCPICGANPMTPNCNNANCDK